MFVWTCLWNMITIDKKWIPNWITWTCMYTVWLVLTSTRRHRISQLLHNELFVEAKKGEKRRSHIWYVCWVSSSSKERVNMKEMSLSLYSLECATFSMFITRTKAFSTSSVCKGKCIMTISILSYRKNIYFIMANDGFSTNLMYVSACAWVCMNE